MFNTIKTAFKNIFSVDVRVSEPGHMYGLSLDEWTYLGYSEIKFVNEAKETTSRSFLFFFSERKNEENGKRIYVHAGSSAEYMKDHTFILTVAEIWMDSKTNLIRPIITRPSEWLEEEMQKEGYSWCNESKGFIPSSTAKYNNAFKEQKKKDDKKEDSKDNNIIEVRFPKV